MSKQADLDLLRRFEPVIRYTRGERFFPMDVEPYVRACSLWVQRPGREPVRMIPQGKLTLEDLSQAYSDEFGAIRFLKITTPLSAAEMAAYTLKQTFSVDGAKKEDDLYTFRAGQGRLARVGYISRFVDALFSISLLARGRVRGDTATAAILTYDRLMAEENGYHYYGRVIRQNGWTILQYWFFYLFNNWRSGFFGVNDHESDWEMINIYLAETEQGGLRPEWVAYALHDYTGDDLRRRWDDPELEKVGDHPIIYAGAGSHASYYTAGEYMTELELPVLAPPARLVGRLQNFWHETLRQYGGETGPVSHRDSSNIFRIPFVDYARGDGFSLGPGQPRRWTAPTLLDPPPAWVTNYRGLWGLYARDPLGGENAPSGPMYNRDGTVRRAWYDPLGWAGLDKVPTPRQSLKIALTHQADVQARQNTLETEIEEKTDRLKQLGVEAAAMRGQPHLGKLYETHKTEIHTLSEEINTLRTQLTSEQALLESLKQYAARLQTGQRGPLRSHINHFHRPTSRQELRLNRLAEFWAAVSIGLMMIGFVALFIFARSYLLWGLVAIVSVFVFVESGFRGRLANLTTSLAIGLSIVTALILIYEFFWPLVSGLVLLAGGYILFENLREYWT